MWSDDQYATVLSLLSEQSDISLYDYGKDKQLTMEDVKTILDLPARAVTEVSEEQQLQRKRMEMGRNTWKTYSEWDTSGQNKSGHVGDANMAEDNMAAGANMILEHPTQILEHPTQILEHPTQILEHPTQILEHPTQILEHPSQSSGRQAESSDGMTYCSESEVLAHNKDRHTAFMKTESTTSYQHEKDEIIKIDDSASQQENTHNDLNNLCTDSVKQYKTQTAPVLLKELDEKVFDLKEEDPVIWLCTVCHKPALKYISYGGTVCSSCRSFFRRSAQSGYHSIFNCKQDRKCRLDTQTRRCQYCRFQSCLRSGMKITWVLSDEERDRRFNKLKKKTNKIIKSNSKFKQTSQSVGRPYMLHLPFSVEETNILKDLQTKFKVPWLHNLFMLDRNAGINVIEYKFGWEELRAESWDTFKQSMSHNFIRYILPRFTELEDISSHDIGQIMNSPTYGIAHFFRSCQLIDIGSKLEGKADICPVTSQVVTLSSNPEIVRSLGLTDLMSRLDLSRGETHARLVGYEDLYPQGWAGNRQVEERHREAVYKIVIWPTDEENVFDQWMAGLMTLILAFNADFYNLVSRDRVEKIQIKYTMILQRYLRSKLNAKAANTKFIEAMLLIAQTRQAWEISCDYRNMF